MIPAAELIADFETMYREHWPYEWGAARKGCVDCSGAFAYAYRLHGLSIAHGSNAIARKSVESLCPISEAAPAYAAFKYYPPGHPKWNLPAKYRKGGSEYNGDLNDYYHVGLVDGTDKNVLNAKSTQAGFSRDPLSKWSCVGRLKAVSYSGESKGGVPMQMVVSCPAGETVRLRNSPKYGAAVVAKIPAGTVVSAEDVGDADWLLVRWDGKAGYMMRKFLADVTSDDEPDTGETVTITLPVSLALALRDALTKELGAG